eukprot:scaffold25176_cov191-Cylindrotheca_fusiformis.AAC.3
MALDNDKTSNSQRKAGAIEKDDCDDDCQYIFPQRLMSVLADEANHEAICWLPHGKAFIIRNRMLFAEKVMPRFFPRKSKYSSFTRKLNRWNFTRVSSGPELGAYYHEFFLRDQPHLAAQMFCKNARTKIAMASPEPEPSAMNQLPSAQQPEAAGLDKSHILMGNTVDPTLQMILGQQPNVAARFNQQKQMQVQKPAMDLNSTEVLSLLMGTMNTGSSPVLGNWLQNEILAQKQQQQRMLQLRQMAAVTLRQQSSKPRSKNNFRASAA